MALAIFDLDNTLIAGDSDHAWGEFLIEKGVVDKAEFKATNDQFYADYLEGKLDIIEYIRFALAPLKAHSLTQLHEWRKEFIKTIVEPMVLPKGLALIEEHKQKGDYCLIITATNQFVTEPIADMLGVDDLIATVPEFKEGYYTGEIVGTPSYQEGKVVRLNEWLEDHSYTISESFFYSDSHNDIPLLEEVGYPIVVDGDDSLLAYAKEKSWQTISLRK